MIVVVRCKFYFLRALKLQLSSSLMFLLKVIVIASGVYKGIDWAKKIRPTCRRLSKVEFTVQKHQRVPRPHFCHSAIPKETD